MMKLKWLSWFLGLFYSFQTFANTPWLEHTLPESANRHYGQHYWVALPEKYTNEPNKTWPVIVFLHGRGEWGDDLNLATKRGLAQYINEGNKLPAIVIVPQSPQNQYWHPLFINAVMEEAAKTYRFDNKRLYLTGLSMGGIGGWSMVSAFPNRFAAFAPTAGSLMNDIAAESMGIDPTPAEQLLPSLTRINHLPTWIFHGDRDSLVPTELGIRSKTLLEQAGGHAKITLYPMTDHDAWSPTYFENPEFYPWLFAQSNEHPQWQAQTIKIDPALYVGNYSDASGSAKATVKALANGGISVIYGPEQAEEELIAISQHDFVGTGFILFEGQDGHMNSITLPGLGTLVYKP